jgi:2-polyprenyl-3-methyl-5-hydroxy-6-metoxy-1,4-benzoquinol methylase
MMAFSFGKAAFGRVPPVTLLWMGLVILAMIIEGVLLRLLSPAANGVLLYQTFALIFLGGILSTHHGFPAVGPRLVKGSAVLAALLVILVGATALNVRLGLNLVLLGYLFRVFYGSLFTISRLLLAALLIYFSYDALISARQDTVELLLTAIVIEIVHRVTVSLETQKIKTPGSKGWAFELENIFTVATGGKRKFWEESYQSGQWNFLDSAQQSPRHVQIAGLAVRKQEQAIELLDVGCGLGTLYNYLPRGRVKYYGLDVSESVTRQNEQQFAAESQARFIAANLLDYRPSDQKFDVIVLNEVLYYFPLFQLRKVVRHCASLLRDSNSTLIISMNKNPKAMLTWEILNMAFAETSNLAVENLGSGSKWYIRTYTRKEFDPPTNNAVK